MTGDVAGNVTGNVTGNVVGNLTGNVTGDVTGDVAGNLTGNVAGNVTGNVTGDVTGNAGTATTLENIRTISLTGDVSGSVGFNGSSNVGITATVADNSHNHLLSNITDAGSMASQDGSNVTITGGSISGITDLAIADGGTGASTAAAARANLNAQVAGNYLEVDTAAHIYEGFNTVAPAPGFTWTNNSGGSRFYNFTINGGSPNMICDISVGGVFMTSQGTLPGSPLLFPIILHNGEAVTFTATTGSLLSFSAFSRGL